MFIRRRAPLLSIVAFAFCGAVSAHGAQPSTQRAWMTNSPCEPAVPAVTPPSGFDPLTASSAELRCYGFPPKPTDAMDLVGWKQAMAHALKYVYPAYSLAANPSAIDSHSPAGHALRHHTVVRTLGGNWGGYDEFINDNTQYSNMQFYQVDATWVVSPANTLPPGCPSGPLFWAWVGLGGVNGANLVQAGSQSMDNIPVPYYELFWEWVTSTKFILPTAITEVPIRAGDTVYVSVQQPAPPGSSGPVQFFVEDQTTNTYTQFTKTVPTSGVSADYVVEDNNYPGGPFVNFPHVPFSFASSQAIYGNNVTSGFNLSQLNIEERIYENSASQNVIVPHQVGGEPGYGFDAYTNSTYATC